jgi:hypothetical protein
MPFPAVLCLFLALLRRGAVIPHVPGKKKPLFPKGFRG